MGLTRTSTVTTNLMGLVVAVVMTLDVHVAAAAVETAEAEARHAAAEAAENQLWVAAQEQRIASRPARARAFAAEWAEGEAADREAMQAEVQLAAAAVETAEAEALETARLAAAAKEWNQLCVAAEVAHRAARARDSQRRVRAALARDSARRDRAKQRRSRQRRVQRRATVPEGDEPLELLGNCELVGFGVTAGSTCHVPTFDLLGAWLDAGNCNAPPSPSSPTSCFEEAAAAFSKRFQCWVQGLFEPPPPPGRDQPFAAWIHSIHLSLLE